MTALRQRRRRPPRSEGNRLQSKHLGGISELHSVGLYGISVAPDRHTKLKEDLVASLAESMSKVGLINPITLRPRGPQLGYFIISGRHRYEAAKRLKWPGISAFVLDGLDALEAEEIEIRENLDRQVLSPAETSMQFARLKAIAEEKHKKTGGNREGVNQYAKRLGRQVGETTSTKRAKKESVSESAKAAAKGTGRSARSVDRDAQRVKAIKDIDKLVGTSLDKGAELDALAKIADPEEQNALIDRAAAGEQVSAKSELMKVERAAKQPRTALQEEAAFLVRTKRMGRKIYDALPSGLKEEFLLQFECILKELRAEIVESERKKEVLSP